MAKRSNGVLDGARWIGVLVSLSLTVRVQADDLSSVHSAEQSTVFSVAGVVQELSGAVLDRQRGMVWSLGDSGTPPILGRTDLQGFSSRSISLINATNVDWEAIALDEGNDLWVFDVGDNDHARPSVRALRINPDRLTHEGLKVEEEAEIFYSGGPRDVEAVIVRNGEALLVEKSYTGRARLAIAPLNRGPVVLAEDRGTLSRGLGPITDASLTPGGGLYLLTYAGVFRCDECGQPGFHLPRVQRVGFRGQVESLIAFDTGEKSAGNFGERFWVGDESGRLFRW